MNLIILILTSILFTFYFVQWQLSDAEEFSSLIKNNQYPSTLNFKTPDSLIKSDVDSSSNISISQSSGSDGFFSATYETQVNWLGGYKGPLSIIKASLSGPLKLYPNHNNAYHPTGTWKVDCDENYYTSWGSSSGEDHFHGNAVLVYPPEPTGLHNNWIGVNRDVDLSIRGTFGITDVATCSVSSAFLGFNGYFPGSFQPNGDIVSSGSVDLPSVPYPGQIMVKNHFSWDIVLGPPHNNPPIPIIDVFPPNNIDSGTTVILDGSRSYDPDPGDNITSYMWQSLNPSVHLNSTSGPIVQFIAPEVQIPTNILITLTVKDSFSAEGSAVIPIRVSPCSPDGGPVEPASTERLTATQMSCDDNDNKPVLDVEVNPPEINPYPSAPFLILSGITITAKNADGTPLSGVGVKVESCTKIGRHDTDGHPHDFRIFPCIKGDRPHASLVWDIHRGNPITVTTDSNGIAKIMYFPPKTTIGSKTYYTSGVDQILATLVTDPSIKDDSKTITTKVPDLQPLIGSGGCIGGGTFFFDPQDNHGCIFYGTSSTNDAIIRIANNFAQKQIDCRDSPNNQCTIIDDKGNLKIITIKGEPKPMKITAMNLPWGGLLDIGPGECKKCKFWNPPHASHNDGKEIDIGFANLIRSTNGNYDMDRIHLLRYVSSIDQNFKSFVPNEGGNIAQTMATIAPHIHIYFKN